MRVLGARLALGPVHSNFRPRALSRSVVALETIAPPPPPVVQDPTSRAHRHLIAGSRASCRFNPSLRARCRHPLPQAVDLDPTSLKACHCYPLPQVIDLDPTPSESTVFIDLDPTPSAFSEGDTPPPCLITTAV
jgi:hypothetical protein